jgi:hypothetical protein
MNAVPFDTLKFARRLEDAGLSGPVAAGAAEAFAEALGGADLATKSDIGTLRTELKNDIELLRRDLTIRLGSMMIVAVGVLLAAIRFMPPH